MPKKRDRGNGHDAAVTNGLLSDIRDLIRGTNDRLDRIDVRLGSVEGRLDRVEQRLERVEGAVERLGTRIDDILTGPVGQAVREQGQAIDDLRTRVFALERPTSPRGT